MRKTNLILALVLGLSAWSAIAQAQNNPPQPERRVSRYERTPMVNDGDQATPRHSRVQNMERRQEDQIDFRREFRRSAPPHSRLDQPRFNEPGSGPREDNQTLHRSEPRFNSGPTPFLHRRLARPNFCPNCGCDLRPMAPGHFAMRTPKFDRQEGERARPGRGAFDRDSARGEPRQIRPMPPGRPQLRNQDQSMERGRPAPDQDERRPGRRQPAERDEEPGAEKE